MLHSHLLFSGPVGTEAVTLTSQKVTSLIHLRSDKVRKYEKFTASGSMVTAELSTVLCKGISKRIHFSSS